MKLKYKETTLRADSNLKLMYEILLVNHNIAGKKKKKKKRLYPKNIVAMGCCLECCV